MSKDQIYMLKMVFKQFELDIIHAECQCPAGKGPQGNCKHIAALVYALADFSHFTLT